MTLLEIFLIGIGLSMDAFAVAICKGLAMPDKVHKRSAFLIALYFGVFQAVMPALGWLLGSQFAHYVTRFAPWIAFVLLAWIGGNMIRESRTEEEEDEQPSDGQVKHKELLVLAVALHNIPEGLALGVVIAAAMNRNSEGRLCGDVDFAAVEPKASYITPVPGGVGPMTRAMLMRNILTAARNHQAEK